MKPHLKRALLLVRSTIDARRRARTILARNGTAHISRATERSEKSRTLSRIDSTARILTCRLARRRCQGDKQRGRTMRYRYRYYRPAKFENKCTENLTHFLEFIFTFKETLKFLGKKLHSGDWSVTTAQKKVLKFADPYHKVSTMEYTYRKCLFNERAATEGIASRRAQIRYYSGSKRESSSKIIERYTVTPASERACALAPSRKVERTRCGRRGGAG